MGESVNGDDVAARDALRKWLTGGDLGQGSTMHYHVPAAFRNGWRDGHLAQPNRHAYAQFDNLRAAYLAGRRAARAYARTRDASAPAGPSAPA